jgi:hypothetical protein
VLDFDGGTLSPEQFEDIFWNKAPREQKHSFIICNSFSRCPEMPNKYRVIFPYLRPARSIAEHKAAYAYVLRRLQEAGHSEESSKLDSACKSGVQSFWMPCTNREFPDSAFFRAHGTKTMQLRNCAIDPQMCLRIEETADGGLRLAKAPEGLIREDLLAQIEAAEMKLRAMHCGRNTPFFDYAVLLARAGFGRSDIEGKLREIAGRETKMLKKIPGILRSLANYGWF